MKFELCASPFTAEEAAMLRYLKEPALVATFVAAFAHMPGSPAVLLKLIDEGFVVMNRKTGRLELVP